MSNPESHVGTRSPFLVESPSGCHLFYIHGASFDFVSFLTSYKSYLQSHNVVHQSLMESIKEVSFGKSLKVLYFILQ